MSSYDLLVNRQNLLEPDEVPAKLIEAGIPFDAQPGDPKRLLECSAAQAARELFCDAAAQGIFLVGISGYRSYYRQMQLYDPDKNPLYVAPPGGSEHQTGLALDVSSDSVGRELTEAFADTPEGQWISKNAHLYGFIIRYPKEKEEITGYAYEPWHIRYVTKPLALYLTITGMTLEEYHRHPATVPFDVP